MNKLLFILITFIASNMLAADTNWYKNSACTTLLTTNNLVAGSDQGTNNAELMFNCFGASTGNTEMITAKNYFKMCFDTDSTSGTTGAARIQVRQCLDNTVSTNTCSFVHVDRDGNGSLDVAALDGTVGTIQNRCTYDLPPGFYYIEYTIGRAGSENPIVQVQVQK